MLCSAARKIRNMNGVRLQTSAITTENSAPTGSASRLRVKPTEGRRNAPMKPISEFSRKRQVNAGDDRRDDERHDDERAKDACRALFGKDERQTQRKNDHQAAGEDQVEQA